MKIKDRPEYKTKLNPLTCSESMTIAEAAKLMAEKNYGSIVIVDKDKRVLGVMTERDLMSRVVAKGIDATTTPVSDVMSRNLRVANENDEVRDWLRIMSNERFRRLPIVDEDGKLVSLLSQGDFVSYTWPSLFEQAADLINQGAEVTKASFNRNTQLTVLIVGFIAYAIISLAVLGFAFR